MIYFSSTPCIHYWLYQERSSSLIRSNQKLHLAQGPGFSSFRFERASPHSDKRIDKRIKTWDTPQNREYKNICMSDSKWQWFAHPASAGIYARWDAWLTFLPRNRPPRFSQTQISVCYLIEYVYNVHSLLCDIGLIPTDQWTEQLRHNADWKAICLYISEWSWSSIPAGWYWRHDSTAVHAIRRDLAVI